MGIKSVQITAWYPREKMTTSIIDHHIDHPSAWKSSDFTGEGDYALDLEPRHIEALDAALVKVRKAGLDLDNINRENFPLDEIQDLIDHVSHELVDGRGLLMIRGWPLERYSLEDIGTMYYGFCAHFGTAVSQSVIGDRLGYVMDHSDGDSSERAYRNKQELSLHTDFNELIGMLNVRQATRGGESQYASAIAIHNEIFATRPKLLAPLYEGFYYHRRGEETPGQEPVTPHKVPIFSNVDGILSCRFVESYLPPAAKELGIEIPADLIEAISYFQEIAARDDIQLEMLVEPGHMIFSNNFITLHARSAFEDDSNDPDMKRLFLRLWLDAEASVSRRHVPEVEVYDGDSITRQEGRTPVYAGEWFDYEKEEKREG